MSKRKSRGLSAKHAQPELSEPASLADQLGPDVKAWVFGPVAKGTPVPGNRLDIYVAGPGAAGLETKFFGRRPRVTYNDDVYAMRLIGPTTISETTFTREHPEAIRIQ